jgi:hypothetical protein
MDKKIKYNVEKFYYDNHRVTTKERDGYPKGEHGLKLYQHKDDEGNYVYVNDDGEYVKSHLEALNIYENNNGGTGLDFAVKTLSEVYIPESRRQIFIITVPHYFRRTWFDDDGVIYKAWEVKEKVSINEYNNYYNFLHNYELVNRFVGRDKVIWGTWDGDLPQEYFDVYFDVFDMADDMLHPGPKSHKRYAEKIKNVLQDRFK